MRLASSKGVIGSSELQRGRAECSSLPCTEVLLPCQAGGGMRAKPGPQEEQLYPPARFELSVSMPSLPPAAGRNHGAAESSRFSSEGLDGAEIPDQLIMFYLCIYATRPTCAVQGQASTCSCFC